MKIKFKKLDPKAVIPTYANTGDAGLDITAIDYVILGVHSEKPSQLRYFTGLAVEIPEGFVGLLFPRSSIHRTDLILPNSVGVIDSGYRGEITAIFNLPSNNKERVYNVGDRILQLVIVPIPKIELEEVQSLSDSERGTRGFGSSGL